jgi:hypothetical protein
MDAMLRLTSLVLLLSSCASSPTLWTHRSIDAGEAAYNLSSWRTSPSELGLEIVKMGDSISSFLTLNKGKFKGGAICFTIEDEYFAEAPPLHQGKMKIELSQDTTRRLILALQRGAKVAILVDEFEEVIEPGPAQFF